MIFHETAGRGYTMHCRVKGDFFLGLSHNCEGSRGRFGPSKNTNCEKKEPKRPTMKKTAPKKLGINSQKKTTVKKWSQYLMVSGHPKKGVHLHPCLWDISCQKCNNGIGQHIVSTASALVVITVSGVSFHPLHAII